MRERKSEQQCQQTLTQYRALRCRICEAQDDLDRIKSAQPTQPD